MLFNLVNRWARCLPVMFFEAEKGGSGPAGPGGGADGEHPGAAEPASGENKEVGAQEVETISLPKTDFEKMQKALKDANAEAAKRRKELEERTKAEMTETDRLKSELAEERKARFEMLRKAIALKHGLPESLASRLQGENEDELEADAAELEKLVPKKKEPSPGPVVGAGASSKPTLTLADVEKMTQAEINARWDEVQKVLEKK